MTAILTKAQRIAAKEGDWATVRALAKPAKRIERTWLKRGTKPLKQVNVERRAKKAKRYAAHLKSAFFRAIRLLAFARDGWQCVETIDGVRCPFVDESRTGKGLHAHHLTYARFTRELLDDLATNCNSCHMRKHAMEGKRLR